MGQLVNVEGVLDWVDHFVTIMVKLYQQWMLNLNRNFLKRFYLFLESGEGREKERERNIDV